MYCVVKREPLCHTFEYRYPNIHQSRDMSQRGDLFAIPFSVPYVCIFTYYYSLDDHNIWMFTSFHPLGVHNVLPLLDWPKHLKILRHVLCRKEGTHLPSLLVPQKCENLETCTVSQRGNPFAIPFSAQKCENIKTCIMSQSGNPFAIHFSVPYK